MTATTKTKQATGRVVFQAYADECRVILSPGISPQYNAGGMQTQAKIPERVVQFKRGRFVADKKTAGRLGFESVDELVEALRGHSGHQGNVEEVGAEFFEVPNDVGAPDPQKDLQTIALLAAGQDVESLERVLRDEREGWGRTVILEAVESSLVLLRENAAVEGAPSA